MTRTETENTVKRIVGDHLGVPGSTLLLSTNLQVNLGAETFDKLELLMTIEEYFGVQIPEEELNTIQTLGDIVQCVINFTVPEQTKNNETQS
jgi:acyl carrier protein